MTKPFDFYEIQPVKDLGDFCEPCQPEEASFWTLYGHIPGQGLEAIGDFSSKAFAQEILARITSLSVCITVKGGLVETVYATASFPSICIVDFDIDPTANVPEGLSHKLFST